MEGQVSRRGEEEEHSRDREEGPEAEQDRDERREERAEARSDRVEREDAERVLRRPLEDGGEGGTGGRERRRTERKGQRIRLCAPRGRSPPAERTPPRPQGKRGPVTGGCRPGRPHPRPRPPAGRRPPPPIPKSW